MKKDITLEEVMTTPLFETNFNNALRDIEQRRAKALNGFHNLQLKASAYSSLEKREMLSLGKMVWELDQILAKKSNLSSLERNWIDAFMRGVVAKTLEEMRRTSASLGGRTLKTGKKTKKNEENK